MRSWNPHDRVVQTRVEDLDWFQSKTISKSKFQVLKSVRYTTEKSHQTSIFSCIQQTYILPEKIAKDSTHSHLSVNGKMNSTMRRSPFLLHLPSEIMINILSRLPVRTILSCKCVCKQLLNLLSTPEFAASHLPLSTPGLVIRQSGLFQIFDFEDGFDPQRHNLHYNLVMKFDPSAFPVANLSAVGSVNGLLCLMENRSELYDALYICNPMTREYIALPMIEGIVKYPDLSEYGFGVSKISGQYKVVRNVHRHSNDHPAAPCSSIENYECLVHTVGTRSWRTIQPGPPFGHYHLCSSLFLNGNLHGFVQDYCDSTNMLISCFDLEVESFKAFPPPPPPLDLPALGTLGILDECLCFVDNSSQDMDVIAIWVMKEYGVGESWTKQFVIAGAQGFTGLFYDLLYPIKAFKDGDILLNWNSYKLFYFDNKTKTCQKLGLVDQNELGWIEAIPHKSSFLSPKSFDAENVILF